MWRRPAASGSSPLTWMVCHFVDGHVRGEEQVLLLSSAGDVTDPSCASELPVLATLILLAAVVVVVVFIDRPEGRKRRKRRSRRGRGRLGLRERLLAWPGRDSSSSGSRLPAAAAASATAAAVDDDTIVSGGCSSSSDPGSCFAESLARSLAHQQQPEPIRGAQQARTARSFSFVSEFRSEIFVLGPVALGDRDPGGRRPREDLPAMAQRDGPAMTE